MCVSCVLSKSEFFFPGVSTGVAINNKSAIQCILSKSIKLPSWNMKAPLSIDKRGGALRGFCLSIKFIIPPRKCLLINSSIRSDQLLFVYPEAHLMAFPIVTAATLMRCQ